MVISENYFPLINQLIVITHSYKIWVEVNNINKLIYHDLPCLDQSASGFRWLLSICRWLCWRHRQINIKTFLSHSFEDWNLEFVTFVSKFNLLFDYLKRWEKSIFPLQSTLDIIVGLNLIELGVFLNLFCFIVVVDYCFLKTITLIYTIHTNLFV